MGIILKNARLDLVNFFGVLLGENLMAGDVVCLYGELGAGKTTLTQAIAKGLLVAADCYVTSPSFAIMHEYPGRLPIYHFDFYRLENEIEVEDLGFAEYFYGKGVCVIEWPEKAAELLPEHALRFRLDGSGQDCRNILYTTKAGFPEHLKKVESWAMGQSLLQQ